MRENFTLEELLAELTFLQNELFASFSGYEGDYGIGWDAGCTSAGSRLHEVLSKFDLNQHYLEISSFYADLIRSNKISNSEKLEDFTLDK